MKNATILLVEDERNTREGMRKALEEDYEILVAENGQQALDVLDIEQVDVVVSDLKMPGMDGFRLVKSILIRESAPVCIMLTAYGSVENAVEAMRVGAHDFLEKPVNLDKLELIIKRALKNRELQRENRKLKKDRNNADWKEKIIGNSQKMQKIFDIIEHAAPTRTSLLISGESGTGKELVARAIHEVSNRRNGPFIPLHCAALSSSLLESELFGHEKGAFTDASERRRGRFELADHGTLFLDEIGEIDQRTQVKILRVLEERAFERVGGEVTIEVDVRLVAATNRNLSEMVKKGEFRPDLYFRLNVIPIYLPPLRERTTDISLLIRHFLNVLSKENDLPAAEISEEAQKVLMAHPWPGNVRQLRNCIEQMLVLSRKSVLNVDDIPDEIRQVDWNGYEPGEQRGKNLNLENAERELIKQALTQTNGNRTEAADLLGISRRTLHRKLHVYGLT